MIIPNSVEGGDVGCALLDPQDNKFLLSCRLDIQFTNNVVEYEALLQGLIKDIDMKVKKLKAIGDYEINVRQVNKTIHFISNHLKNYRQDV